MRQRLQLSVSSGGEDSNTISDVRFTYFKSDKE